MKKGMLALLLCLCLLPVCSLAVEPVALSFKAASSYEYLKTLSGRQVTINGYLATSSPVDGSFIFLMNLPYQSCPFCKPNTSQLSNTMEVYPKEGKTFGYTTQAVRVTGTLVVASDGSFTDRYGYEFNFKIIDAEYTIIKAEDLSPEMAVWQKIAQSDVISEIYAMYDYVYFLCNWPDFSVSGYTDEKGNQVPGYFLYATDAEWFIKTDGAQYNYGYADGYFDDIISTVRSCDASAFEELVQNVQSAQALAEWALNELDSRNYTYTYKTLEQFGTDDYVFSLNASEELLTSFDTLYYEFTDWLGNWEM